MDYVELIKLKVQSSRLKGENQSSKVRGGEVFELIFASCWHIFTMP
jgi:hypothetical protein